MTVCFKIIESLNIIINFDDLNLTSKISIIRLTYRMKKPKNYYCHRNIDKIQDPLDLPAVQVIDKIGEGSFGTVYKVFDPMTSKLMVIKKKKGQSDAGFTQENQVLKKMSSSQGFEKIRANMDSTKNQIYMQCLGPSIGSILHKVKKMNPYSMKRIAYQLIKRLKELHSHSFIHRDLKPDNILLGNQNQPHNVFLIDFGLTISYKRKATKAKKIYDGLLGTAKFCPIAAHQYLEQFPKDDLESLGYILSYMVSGSLPWQNLGSKSEKQLFQKIKQKKQSSSIQQLCSGLSCLREYFTQIKKIEIGAKIDYKKLMNIFKVENDNDDCCYDFCQIIRGKCRIQLEQQKAVNNEILSQGKPNMIRCSILN